MGVLTVAWDNTAVNASPIAIGQRVSKRIKAVGGAFDTVGFAPPNDLPKTANTTDATVTNNRVYEFKVEALCSEGGPTPNVGGLKDGIVFACLLPEFTPTFNSLAVTLSLLNLDITKIRVKLYDDATDTLQDTQTANKIGDDATVNFAGLDPGTAYYVTIELYATVDGVEVISSAAEYLNAVCGGNEEGYQVSTDAAPACPAPTDLVITNA